MAVNTLGAVQINDFGNPRTITLRAAGVVSGGQLVFPSGAAGVVSSGASSLAAGDLNAVASASGLDFIGIALNNAADGEDVAVAVDGAFIVRAEGAITGGKTVITTGSDAVAVGTVAGKIVGRALCAAASGGYTVVRIGQA